ncbi:MAG: nucleotide exchange factor GrpE [Firmicutes bacterium]|nr:nucleotide exchange factor GrpE [Bacillota bacterium]
MLDISKEIKEYGLIDLEQDPIDAGGNELQEIIGNFSKVFERLGKEQYKFSQQLEGVFSILESEEDKLKPNGVDQEVKRLLQVLLKLADSLEDVYRYALRSDQGAWRNQLSLQWEKVGRQMEVYGIRRIEGAGNAFDSRLHVAQEVKEYPGVSDGQILDIIKSGYLLGETIVRKAEVVVNRFKA